MINQQHECQQWLFVKTVKLFIAQVFIKTLPNRIFMAVLFVLRVIALFGILLWGTNSDDSIGEGRNGSGGQSTVIIHQPAILFILWLCLVFTILLSLGIAYILYKFYNLTKRSTKRTQQQSYLFNIIQKTNIFNIAVIFVAFVAVQEQGQFGQQLQQQRQGQVTALVVSNLLLGLGLVYPLSGVGFWNKIGIRQNGLAYCTVMNTQSLVFVFVPIIIILRVHAYSIYPYVSILLAILSVMTLYIYPLVSFNHNKLHTIASCSMVNVLFVMGLCVLVKAQISTFGRFVVVLLAVGVGVVAMWQLQQYRVRLLLCIKGVVDSNEDGNNNSNMNNYNNQNTNKANNNNSINNNMNHININTNQQQIPKINNNPQPITTNKLSWIDSQSYYQNLLYHLINWQYCQNDLLLHVIATLKYTSSNSSNGLYEDAQLITGNQPKVLKSSLTTSTGSNNPFQYVLKLHSNHNHHNHSSINSSSSHSSYPYPPPSPPSPLSQILTTLTFQTIPQQTLHQLFCTLISQKLTTKCNLQQIERQKMGHRQLLKVLQQSMGYFILLLQSLMLNNSNLTKTYLLIKLQQQLLRQSQTSSFMQSTYALTIVQMIQSYFIQQFKTHTNQYSPGQNYFLFQQKYQKLKNYIKLSAQNKLSFWKQTNKEQPLQKKLKQCITKNYLFQMKILKHTHKIINSYHTSPLILLTLVQSYAQLALNTNMSSSKNIFNFLAVEFHKLYNQNKSKYFNNINNNNNHIKTNQLKDQLKDNQSKYGNNGTLNNFTNISTIKDNHTIGTKSYKLQNNLYVQLQNNPSSHLQKQNIHPIEKYEQTNYNKYAIEKSIGVFLINLQSQQYKIQWANQYFWENYTYHGKTEESSSQDDKDKDKDNKDKQEQKDIKLNDFIIPQLRIVHDKYVHDFIHQGASLAYKHKQTELYFPDDQTFINVKMEFQFLPSLAEGLKMMGFVHPAKGIKKDLVQIMIRSDLTFVACTKSFMDHYDEYSLVKDHLNFEKDKALAFDIIMQNNIFGEFFNNIRLKQSGYGRKKQQKVQEKQQQQDLQSRITHLGMDYVVKLKKKIQYQGKNRDGMKQSQLDTKKHLLVFELETEESMMTTSKTEVLTMEEKQFVSTPMKKSPTHKGSLQPMAESLFIQQDKIDQSPRSLRGSQSTFFKGSQSTLFKGSQTLRSGRTSPKDQHDDIIMEDILIKEREKIQDKPLQIINLQKCYEILVSQRTPNNVKKWRIFTVIVLVLLMGAMVCNMAFLTQRQNLYEQNKDLAINYSSLIADLSATVTAIREYNFYVATYSTDRPEIPFLVKKLFQLSDLISKKVKLLASVLKKAWMAYEILPTGATIDVQDTSYVVISNYLLSSVTFTSQLPASNMSFPILVEEMYASEETPTPAQISFLEAVFNGLYVAIPNLLVDRKQFIHEMIDNLLSTSGMYFIYTCIGGASCLFVFFTLSLLLQLRSQGIRSQTGGLLSSHIISGQQKSKKIERLQKLGEILQNSKGETVVVPDWQDEQAKYKYLDILACTLKDMDHRDQQIHHQQQQGQSDIELNAIISKQQIIDDKTNREFMDNEESLKSSQVSSSVDGDRLSQQHTQKGMKKGDMESIETLQKSKNNKPRKSNFNRYKNEKGGNFQLYTITFKQRSLLIIFYLIVCIPFLGYFISILVGSMSMNSKITNHITITSQVYNRKSYQEIVYLLTRETAYFETFLVQKVGDWNKYLMAMIDETYDRGRKVEKLIMEQKTATNLQNKLDQLNHNNLCQKLSQFSTSTYYNITFTKQECEIIGYNIMTQGYKQLVVSLLQTSLQLNKNYPNPANLTISQRIDYLQNTQLRRMKGLLAYSEQFVQQLVSASLVDLQVQIQQLRQLSILLSMISIFSLILFLVVVRYRYQKLVLQRRQVQSIISLISIQTISDSLNPNQKQKTQNNQLIKMVQKIDWMFYQ